MEQAIAVGSKERVEERIRCNEGGQSGRGRRSSDFCRQVPQERRDKVVPAFGEPDRADVVLGEKCTARPISVLLSGARDDGEVSEGTKSTRSGIEDRHDAVA